MERFFKYIIIFISTIFLSGCSVSNKSSENTVVTSFYPIYSFTLAITENTPIAPVNLTKTQTGCLHDYQLTTGNMRLINIADVFIINGAGMEDGFINKAIEQNSSVKIIDSSVDISLLETKAHSHEEAENEDFHEHGEFNSHIWMSVTNAQKQVKNIASQLGSIYPQYADTFNKNAQTYCDSLSEANKEIISYNQNINVISFHEAFSYICNDFGINVVETVDIDENTIPSAAGLAHIADEMREHDVSAILCADDGGRAFAETMARELNIPVYILNPITGGENDKNGYINAQKENYKLLREGFGYEKP